MELNGYNRPACNKLRVSSNYASIVVGVIHKLDRRRVLLTTRSTCRSEISSKSRVRGKVPEGSTLIFLRSYPNFKTASVG